MLQNLTGERFTWVIPHFSLWAVPSKRYCFGADRLAPKAFLFPLLRKLTFVAPLSGI